MKERERQERVGAVSFRWKAAVVLTGERSFPSISPLFCALRLNMEGVRNRFSRNNRVTPSNLKDPGPHYSPPPLILRGFLWLGLGSAFWG